MRPTLFISDLHLDGAHENIVAMFLYFLNTECVDAEALYILGDLFEYWVGDDQLDHDPIARQVADALRKVSDAGVKIFFMHGNRDFLIGERFAHEAGLTILVDPTEVLLEGKRVLLMHGDTLCMDDVAYQAFRKTSRDPAWQATLLANPYSERVTLAKKMRDQSTFEKSMKPEDIMDASPETVKSVFSATGVDVILHGHTHRPGVHRLLVDDVERVRRVLSDWPRRPSELGESVGSPAL